MVDPHAGMVGNYNGDVTDDVRFRNGTLVPLSEFSFRILHQVGLSCELLILYISVVFHCYNSLCMCSPCMHIIMVCMNIKGKAPNTTVYI